MLRGDADIGATHTAVPHQFAKHKACGIGGDRKADALRAHDHRGVYADDFAVRRHQRAAGIAGVERRIGLDHVVDQPAGARAQAAAERRDHAGGHRRFEAERIADGDHQLAALQFLGIAERGRRQGHRLDEADKSQIGVGIVADQAGGDVLALGRRHFDARRGTGSASRAGNVAVGQDQPIRRHHDAGTGAAARAAVGFAGMNCKSNHRWADPVDHVDDGTRIGVEERLVLDRNFGRSGCGSAAAAPGGIVQGYDFHVLSGG